MKQQIGGSARPERHGLARGLLAQAVAAMTGIVQAEVKLDSNGFNASSDDGRYSFGVHGRIQFDAGGFDNDDRGVDNVSGTELRRVRLAVSGKIEQSSKQGEPDVRSHFAVDTAQYSVAS